MINNSDETETHENINLKLYVWTIVHPGILVSFIGLVIFFISLDISDTNIMTVVGIVLIVTGASMVTLCPRPCERPSDNTESIAAETVSSSTHTLSHRASTAVSPIRTMTSTPDRSGPETPRRVPSRMSSLVVIVPSSRAHTDAPPDYSVVTNPPLSPHPPEYDSPPSYEEALRLAVVKMANE